VRRATVALLLVLAGCGGGSKEPKSAPATSTAPATSSAPAVTPETKAVRDAVAATLAKCPCQVSVMASAFGDRDHAWRETWKGVYDPAAGTTRLVPGSSKNVELRIVGGTSYVRLTDGLWRRLDFSKLPAEPKSPLASLVFADPGLAFALAKNVGFVTLTKSDGVGAWYEAELGVLAAVADAGPNGAVLTRFFPNPSLYDSVALKNGLVSRLGVSYSEDTSFSAAVFVERFGVASPKVEVPDTNVAIDVAVFTG
jgi:hypothetical protein